MCLTKSSKPWRKANYQWMCASRGLEHQPPTCGLTNEIPTRKKVHGFHGSEAAVHDCSDQNSATRADFEEPKDEAGSKVGYTLKGSLEHADHVYTSAPQLQRSAPSCASLQASREPRSGFPTFGPRPRVVGFATFIPTRHFHIVNIDGDRNAVRVGYFTIRFKPGNP